MLISDWSSDVCSSDLKPDLMKDEADRNLGRRGPVIDSRSREKANSKLRRWNNLRGLRSGNSRRGIVGVETKIADVPARARDRQSEISRTRAVRKLGGSGKGVLGREDLGGSRII